MSDERVEGTRPICPRGRPGPTLPPDGRRSEPSRQEGWPVEPPRGTETILIVDDDPAVINVTRSIVERLGYTTLTAHNGRQAVEIVRTFDGDIHLVILDLMMPVMGGAEAFPLLVAARPGIKVLIISSWAPDATAQALLDAGAAAFIPKPFHVVTLAVEIRRALDARPKTTS